MTRRLLFTLIVLTCLTVGAQRAAAQQRFAKGTADNPVGPTVSPYLNLLNADQFGVTSYQALVRPLMQQGNAINRQGYDISRMQQQMYAGRRGAGGPAGPAATGHVTFFMNHMHFYPAPPER